MGVARALPPEPFSTLSVKVSDRVQSVDCERLAIREPSGASCPVVARRFPPVHLLVTLPTENHTAPDRPPPAAYRWPWPRLPAQGQRKASTPGTEPIAPGPQPIQAQGTPQRVPPCAWISRRLIHYGTASESGRDHHTGQGLSIPRRPENQPTENHFAFCPADIGTITFLYRLQTLPFFVRIPAST